MFEEDFRGDVLQRLMDHHDSDTLVVGPVLEGHKFRAGDTILSNIDEFTPSLLLDILCNTSIYYTYPIHNVYLSFTCEDTHIYTYIAMV